jgi:nitrate/nitrite-specific signal transduction histidine kinase
MPEQMFQAVEGEHAREDLYLFRTQAVPLSGAMIDALDKETTLQQDLLQSDLNAGREQLSNAERISIFGALAVIMAGLILAFAISRTIARPILQLTGVAEQIRSGDLAAQASVASEDEIGLLAETFNSMTAKLRETLQSLLDYLEQVKVVMSAAAAVEEDKFEPARLDDLGRREDALGQLARVFQKMAREVRIREDKLKQQVKALTIEIDATRQEKKVAEITETEYFKTLQNQTNSLRAIISGVVDNPDDGRP